MRKQCIFNNKEYPKHKLKNFTKIINGMKKYYKVCLRCAINNL